MIVQACINGSRKPDFHPLFPATIEDMVRDAAAVIEAGAAELHVHPRDADGRESLAAVDKTVAAIRRACPGTLIGVSTGAWIEGDKDRTREAISRWRVLPDYASVNLSEEDAPAVIDLLGQKGVGVEAGLATVADARRFVETSGHDRVLRILVELDNERDLEAAMETCDGIMAVLRQAGVRRPILLHGYDQTVWPFVKRARTERLSTRVGLEDGKHLPDGRVARDNAEIVSAAVALFRQ
ncbi:MAG: 3-keto-5-aminohexanoate cleavage protein [Alphaproteobacteria bacterium]|nr:3-keto-5-aminohexanoate cleavage protein [Rhizobiaceae bacterium]MBU3959301.1 3-keto-5-aminohexanoate cleavage protein [Alphaproteobacteria bacterium]MBU4050016.1 3-keto-5-aminohexanoate cleavage protein [Alphaproteobacteria bacterium]MBU4089438.1 3-keto-5-aminohexanoate cleavage protein [Alphaproteobacteria bacterium]MBU4155323.1 3-keto-5-aminohexanoate cleavage protein [Alphaproteobacteria bacterium]